jgi:hypothetical protein
MSANKIAASLEITHQSASSLIKAFEEMEILRESTGRKKNRLYEFSDYLHLFTGKVSRSPIRTKRR